jgi:hypothetical protein
MLSSWLRNGFVVGCFAQRIGAQRLEPGEAVEQDPVVPESSQMYVDGLG